MSLKPIVMTPAYRYGAMTPWGGDSLRTIYGQDIPDEHTGEALEFSALPGLNSTDAEGRTLTELIAEYGDALLGTDVSLPVPLLLKLIDARQDLSVQVHPDDAYAAGWRASWARTRPGSSCGRSPARDWSTVSARAMTWLPCARSASGARRWRKR